MTPENLRSLLEQSWNRWTSADPDEWDESRPSVGQCAVTALIVQEYMGGVIVRAPVPGGSHYWNIVSGDADIDLTADQFPDGVAPLDDEPEERTVYELLANERTAERWRILRERLETALLRQTDALAQGEQSDE